MQDPMENFLSTTLPAFLPCIAWFAANPQPTT
jgi:hypothetical protein